MLPITGDAYSVVAPWCKPNYARQTNPCLNAATLVEDRLTQIPLVTNIL